MLTPGPRGGDGPAAMRASGFLSATFRRGMPQLQQPRPTMSSSAACGKLLKRGEWQCCKCRLGRWGGAPRTRVGRRGNALQPITVLPAPSHCCIDKTVVQGSRSQGGGHVQSATRGAPAALLPHAVPLGVPRAVQRRIYRRLHVIHRYLQQRRNKARTSEGTVSSTRVDLERSGSASAATPGRRCLRHFAPAPGRGLRCSWHAPRRSW